MKVNKIVPGIRVAGALLFLALVACTVSAVAQDRAAEPGTSTLQTVDRVVAMVDNQIILLSDVQQQMREIMLSRDMDERTTPPAQLQALFRDVLQAMVDEELMVIKAERDSIKIDERQVDALEREQIEKMRSQHDSNEEFVAALVEYGLSEQQLRYMVRKMAYNRVLQDTFLGTLEQGISVTPTELEQWVEANKDSLPDMPDEYRISHVMLRPKLSDAQKAELRKRLTDLRGRALAGEDFAELAKKYSEDPGSAVEGGDLGYFRKEEMVPEFSNVAFSLKKGELSDVFETSFGYHILRVDDIRGNQVSARHILLLAKPTAQDEDAIVQRLTAFRADILAGKVTFEDIAKQYSDDENSRELGGRLQWQTDEQGVPEFIKQAKAIKVGEISEPFKTQYGYHIIRYDNYRKAHVLNAHDDNQIVRQMVINQKRIAELRRVLDRVRADVFIQVNLD